MAFRRQHPAPAATNDEDFVPVGSLRLTADQWIALLGTLVVAAAVVYGSLVVAPRAKRIAGAETARLASFVRVATVARDVVNGSPVGVGTVLPGPVSSAAVYVEYDSAIPRRDEIVATLAWAGGSRSCSPWRTPQARGSYYCRWERVSQGSYEMRVAVNGVVVRRVPFSVEAASFAATPSVKRGANEQARAERAFTVVEPPAERWDGHYRFKDAWVPFDMELRRVGKRIKGTIREIVDGRSLTSTVEGTIEGQNVRFKKRYQDAWLGAFGIKYEGEITADGRAMAGTWADIRWSDQWRAEKRR
ncbi:MAG: hypothetical protein ACREQY_19905 [Candidatus Binatia bacterium]